MTEKLYKFLDGVHPTYAREFTYSLPTKNDDGTWTPGEWTPAVEGELKLCENGYHLCRTQDLIYWFGPDLYEAEADGDRVEDNEPPETKIAVRQVRLLRKVETWNDRTARLFAVWCAREALKLIEHPDPRSVAACDVAERFANGEATQQELDAARDAARDAAWVAAWSAARHAAWVAAWSAAWSAARHAARDAAWSAARHAARDAARHAAWVAARDAQTEKLLEMLGE